MSSGGFLRRQLRYKYYNATIILIAVNVVVFLAEFLTGLYGGRGLAGYLALTPALVIQGGAWWQVVTYMFAHANFWHLFFNMLTLYLFGIQLEHRMGSSEFLLFYFVAGIGAGLVTLVVNWYTGQGLVPVLGASGAIFGLLLAFAAFFPNAMLYIFGILPMRAPTAVLVFIVINLFSLFTGLSAGVANLTHLAGVLFGWVLLRVRYGVNPMDAFIRRR